MRFSRLCIAMIVIFAGSGRAQIKPAPFTCTVSQSTQPIIRKEGITELIGDLTLACTGGTPTAAGQPVPTLNIIVALNTGMTSPIIVPKSAFTSALLAIDDAAPVNQVLAPVNAGSGLSYPGTLSGTGSGINYAGGGVPNFFVGAQANVNTVTWLGVPVDPSGNGTRTLRLTNIRANAAGLGTPVPNVSTPVVETVKIFDGATGLLISSFGPQTVALIQKGFSVGATTGFKIDALPYNFPFNASNASASTVMKFTEGFASSFKRRTLAPQNIPGFVYNTEAGFTNSNFGPGFDPLVAGTRLKTTITNIPSLVAWYMPTFPASGAWQLELSSAGTPAGAGFVKLPVAGGSATAIYEVVNDDANASSFNIPLYFSYNSGGTIATAPPSPVTLYALSEYRPGFGFVTLLYPFVSTPPPGLAVFSIISTNGQTPQLTGTLDSRPCILGPVFNYPGNACAPNDGPAVSITSDTGGLNPSFTASAAGGITIVPNPGAFNGTTPVNAVLQVDGSKAAPGTYQSTLKFTAPGSANSFSVPFTATVLPANNPVIVPQGVVDALSYQSGSIAPGQIYAIFGQNFGPASGVVGAALDGSGKLPSIVGGTQVTFDGVPSPMLYVANNQLAGLAPFGLKGKTSTNVQVIFNSLKSPIITLPVSAAAIALSSADASGGGGGTILNQDNTLNTPANPARVGDTVVMYASYAGPLNVNGTDGRTTTGPPYPAPAGPVSVTFGGVAATNIAYFGNAPTLLESVMQINVVIPAGVKPDLHIPVIIAAGGATSTAWCTLAVK